MRILVLSNRARSTCFALLAAMFGFLLTACETATDPVLEASETPVCVSDRATLLALDFETFDQDMANGWRPIADREACLEEAASLIADYRDVQHDVLNERQTRRLLWHEGQLRAATGDYSAAIELMQQTKQSDNPAQNAYIEATLAFLRRDLPDLEQARERLASVPQPPGFLAGVEKFKQAYPDRPPPVWPLNLGVVDDLVACFEAPYSAAYVGDC